MKVFDLADENTRIKKLYVYGEKSDKYESLKSEKSCKTREDWRKGKHLVHMTSLSLRKEKDDLTQKAKLN